MIVTPLSVTIFSPGTVDLAVAAADRGQVDDDAARLHVRDHVGGDRGRRPAADQCGGDHDVGLGGLLRVHPGGRPPPGPRSASARTRRRRPAAGPRRPARSVAPIDSICSPTSGRTSNARTCAPRLTAAPIAARPGHAGADDEHRRGLGLAGRGDLPGEHAAVGLGRLDDSPVPGDVATWWTARPSTAPGRSAGSPAGSARWPAWPAAPRSAPGDRPASSGRSRCRPRPAGRPRPGWAR